MRLIDADAVIKELDEYNEFAVFDCESVKDIINDAPTVEPKLKDDIIEAFNQITDQEFEHHDSFWIITPKGKKIEFEKKRPQGEWTIIDKDHVSFKFKICSNCGKEAEWLDGGSQFLSKFCPNCGADMRKETHNETN